MKNSDKLCIFGEVLFDCFPDGSRILGGAPFNVAWHCQAFGLAPNFISRVGEDSDGEKIKRAMDEWGMNTSGLQKDPVHATGVVNVTFNNDEPAYDIVKNSAWDFIKIDELPQKIECQFIYHGSLALRSKTSAQALDDLRKNNAASVFVDINLRTPWWKQIDIRKIIAQAKWLKLNEEELSLIEADKKTTEDKISALFKSTDSEVIFLTRGGKGAMAVTVKSEQYDVVPDKTTSVVDTVGAGDAFSSVILTGIIKNWSLKDTLYRAQQFASAIVGIRGATIQDKNFYQPYIQDWKL